jgi:glutaredoxin
LKAWAESLGGITYPLLSDFWPHGEVAQKYGVLRSEGYSERAIFIIDKKGVIQYIDIHDINDQPSNEVLFNELGRIEPGSSAVIPTHKPEGEELPQGGVVMYCTSWCPDCRKARKWLAEHQIDYVEVDVAANPKGAAQVRKWANGNLVTPTLDIHGTIVVDWDEEKVAHLLQN